MAKQVNKTWQEAIAMMSDCTVVGRPRLQHPNTLLIQLKQPGTGDKFIISIASADVVGLNGDLLALRRNLNILALVPEPGDKLWEADDFE